MSDDPLPVPWRRRARARAVQLAVGAGAWLPNAALARAIGLGARMSAGTRPGKLARANVERVLASDASDVLDARRDDVDGFLKDVARFAGRQAAEWLRLARGADPDESVGRGAWIEEIVEVDASIGRLDALLEEGRGAIVVTAHIGNWELLCARLRRRGATGAVVGRVRQRDPSHSWLVDLRRAYGVETLPQDASARHALGVLRDGGTLGLLADLPTKRLDSLEVPFLGLPSRTITAPAAFARVNGTPLVPVRCVATDGGRGRYVLSVDEPLRLSSELSREAAQRDLLERMNAVFEHWIRATPEQWAWHQRRWD